MHSPTIAWMASTPHRRNAYPATQTSPKLGPVKGVMLSLAGLVAVLGAIADTSI